MMLNDKEKKMSHKMLKRTMPSKTIEEQRRKMTRKKKEKKMN
jgi:hypothetical protein